MEEVKKIYLVTDTSQIVKLTGKNYATGLIVELVNGEKYAQLSTDWMAPFEAINRTGEVI